MALGTCPRNWGGLFLEKSKICQKGSCSTAEYSPRKLEGGVFLFKSKIVFCGEGTFRFECILCENGPPPQSAPTLKMTLSISFFDVCHILKEDGLKVSAHCTADADQVIGINSKVELEQVSQIVYRRRNKAFMEDGVTIIDSSSTLIDDQVEIGQDCVIYPFTVIKGVCKIGDFCQVGPHAFLDNEEVASHTRVAPFSKK